MRRLGIMQGRLSPPINNQIQAFPVDHWGDEFSLCRELGLKCMEWIFEYQTASENPLASDDGIEEIVKLSEKYGIKINSVVADYFMIKKLFGPDNNEVSESINTLLFLIEQCRKCHIPIIEIPLVDSSELKTESDKVDLIENIRYPIEKATEANIKISLETSLAPNRFRELIDAFNPINVFVNYDMGNSASLGYNPREEMQAYGEYIINVHIKDRIKGGTTVPLGQGDTDFLGVFKALKECNYKGDFIFQSARRDIFDSNKKEIPETIQEYIDFINPFFKELS